MYKTLAGLTEWNFLISDYLSPVSSVYRKRLS